MALKHGTHLPHASGTAGVSGGPAPTVRYRSGGIWPGITTGFDARCTCTWAVNGVYQVKYADVMCTVHGGSVRPRPGTTPARQIGHGVAVSWRSPPAIRSAALWAFC